MFTVGLDTSALLPGFKEHAQRGIGRYVLELSRYFQSVRDENLNVKAFNHRDLLNGGVAGRIVEALPFGRTTMRQQLVYPLRLGASARAGFDVVHFPAHMDAPAWSPGRYAVTVLDLIPLIFKDLYKAAQPSLRFHFARFLELRAIKNASLVLAISENTARDVQRILGIPRERIVVTPLGVDSSFFEARVDADDEQGLRRRIGISSTAPLVLYVGGIDQRKNMRTLLTGFKGASQNLRSQGREAPLLLMAGKIDQDRQYPALKSMIHELGLDEEVRLLGYVPEAELFKIYAMSSVFFFPSLYEGFGLPPLEAMAAGLPVVSSDTSAMPEVLGEAALYFRPDRPEDAATALVAVLSNRELAQGLAARGRERARCFSWQRTGEETLKAYRSLAV